MLTSVLRQYRQWRKWSVRPFAAARQPAQNLWHPNGRGYFPDQCHPNWVCDRRKSTRDQKLLLQAALALLRKRPGHRPSNLSFPSHAYQAEYRQTSFADFSAVHCSNPCRHRAEWKASFPQHVLRCPELHKPFPFPARCSPHQRSASLREYPLNPRPALNSSPAGCPAPESEFWPDAIRLLKWRNRIPTATVVHSHQQYPASFHRQRKPCRECA